MFLLTLLADAHKKISIVRNEKETFEKMMEIYQNKVKSLEEKLEESKFAISSSILKPRDTLEDTSFGLNSPYFAKPTLFQKHIPTNIIVHNTPDEKSEKIDEEEAEIMNNIGLRTAKVSEYD